MMKSKVVLVQDPPLSAPAPTDGGLRRWDSPVPYLLGGLGLMLVVVAVALILLLFSYCKSSHQSSPYHHKSEIPLRPEMEPRVVVIMAGQTNPTHLAKPIPAAAATVVRCTHQHVSHIS
ncbi:protein GLUTAMINE DUMPER 5 [Sesamum alatum]|uniref:Protein GLUTAMINE DUMPER 5 n=1 Tax=Sesamum alatum TaxID=300844 RepID=A0AAE1XT24_9LAMI|nr:protein GLUTAMINE DUMPER 5 [Sesamum alatum]